MVLPMLRLGDGSRLPSLGSEPFVFILGPWAQVGAYGRHLQIWSKESDSRNKKKNRMTNLKCG